MSVFDCKPSMVQEQWSTTGGDGHLKRQPQAGPGPYRWHTAYRGATLSHGTHRESRQKKEAPLSGRIAVDCDYRFQDQVWARWPKDQGKLGTSQEMLAPGVQGPSQTSSLSMGTYTKGWSVCDG